MKQQKIIEIEKEHQRLIYMGYEQMRKEFGEFAQWWHAVRENSQLLFSKTGKYKP